MITVNFDAVDNNIFTLVERTIEVNFGNAQAVASDGSATTAAIIPSVEADITAFGEVLFDAFQDWGGIENNYFDLDVDVAANPETTIFVLDDSDGMAVQYNFLNAEINKVYYFKFGNTWGGDDNPMNVSQFFLAFDGIGDTDLIANGADGIEIPFGSDMSVAAGTILCFIITEPVTISNIKDVVKFSYYKDDFRLLPRKYVQGTDVLEFLNMGRQIQLRKDNSSLKANAGNLYVDFTKARVDVFPFATVSNKREDYIGVTTEEDWLIAALGYKVSPNVDYTTGTDLHPVQGNQSYTLPNSTLTLAIRADNKVGWKGVFIITPATFSLAFAAGWIPMPGSEAFSGASSKVIIEWKAISNTECIYMLKNIA